MSATEHAPAQASVRRPKRKLMFRHKRILDEEALKAGYRKPAVCIVTMIRQGSIYYAVTDSNGAYGKAKDFIPEERWDTIYGGDAPIPF